MSDGNGNGNGKKPTVLPTMGSGVAQVPTDPDLLGELPPALQVLMPDIPPEILDPHGMLGRKDTLPGWEGIPFRGVVPQLKNDDPEQKQPREGFHAYTNVFRLDKQEDLEAYTKIKQVIANGFGMMGSEERQYDDSIKSWRIMICWWRVFSFVPKQR